jgi:hypothetical protein
MARLIRCLRWRVSRGQESPHLLLIKPEEVMLFQTGTDSREDKTRAIFGARPISVCDLWFELRSFIFIHIMALIK